MDICAKMQLYSATHCGYTPRAHAIGNRKVSMSLQYPLVNKFHTHNQYKRKVQVKDSEAEKQRSFQTVKFKVPYETAFGTDVKLVGPGDELGNWNPQNAFMLKWSEGNIWEGETQLPVGPIEFKIIVAGKGGKVQWELGDNRKVYLKTEHKSVPQIQCKFNDVASTEYTVLDENDVKEESFEGPTADLSVQPAIDVNKISDKVVALEEDVAGQPKAHNIEEDVVVYPQAKYIEEEVLVYPSGLKNQDVLSYPLVQNRVSQAQDSSLNNNVADKEPINDVNQIVNLIVQSSREKATRLQNGMMHVISLKNPFAKDEDTKPKGKL